MRGGPLTLTLIPIFWNIWVWMHTFSSFNPNYKTKFNWKKLAIMNLCAGGLGGIVAGLQMHIKSKKLWFCFVVGSILDITMIYLVFILIADRVL